MQLLRKMGQRLGSIPSVIALAVANVRAVEQCILRPRYLQALERHKEHLPTLDSLEARIVADFDQQGYSKTSLDALELSTSGDLVDNARKLHAILTEELRRPGFPSVQTYQSSASQLMRFPAIFRWGLERRLCRIVEGYLRLPVAYDSFSYYVSVADGHEAGPRRWHRDREDRRMIKICVYITDVDEETGRFRRWSPLQVNCSEILTDSTIPS